MLYFIFVTTVCGIVAWLIHSSGMPQPFKNIILAVLVLIVVVVFFSQVLGVNTGVNMR